MKSSVWILLLAATNSTRALQQRDHSSSSSSSYIDARLSSLKASYESAYWAEHRSALSASTTASYPMYIYRNHYWQKREETDKGNDSVPEQCSYYASSYRSLCGRAVQTVYMEGLVTTPLSQGYAKCDCSSISRMIG